MVTFLQDNNPPRVWDPVKNKVTAIFQNGEFETDDPSLIDLLVRGGYRYDGVLPEPKPKTSPAKPKRMARRKK